MKYRYHWLFKVTALVLAAVSGAMLWLGGAGLILGELVYYERSRESQQYQKAEQFCSRAADAVFDRFAWKGTGIEPRLFERFFRWGADVDAAESLEYDFCYTIRDQRRGQILDGSSVGQEMEWAYGGNYDVRRGFVTEMPKAAYYPSFREFTESGKVYTDLEGNALPPLNEGVTAIEYYVVSNDSSVNWQNISMESYSHADAHGSDYTIYRMEYTYYESYYVEIGLTAEQLAAVVQTPIETEFIPKLLAKYSEQIVPVVLWSALVLVLALLWLALLAGGSPHRPGIKPGGLNLLPLDIWLVGAVVAAVGILRLSGAMLDEVVWNSAYGQYDAAIENLYGDALLLMLLGGAAGGGLGLFTMACAAQMKVGGGYWLKHTCVGICWRYGRRLIRKAAVGTVAVAGGLARMLPLSWQWLIASGVLWLVMAFCCIVGFRYWEPWLLVAGVVLTVLPVLYGAYCFGALRSAAKKMSEGNLEEKLESKFLYGCFGEFAGHLNALGDTCVESARQQMKSERMKTELITNVSHDIKTPLTSIINYVDLLQKTDDEIQRAQYLEVLDRQSQRLKKLIGDLMDMSRASSGNVAVEINPTDVTEAVSQALGEFADALQSCGLTLLYSGPREPVWALCDGRHLWRVLSNCLSNAVKYAMPGTRVYVDVAARGQKVEISVKNISAQMLNISADELMERFVRGDEARNTEGSGLGLNIAKSLMELQGGRLDLSVDGDLFKVVLTLNSAE